MNLYDIKQELLDGMKAAGLPALDYVPEQVTPPKVLIAAGDPYIEEFEGSFSETTYKCRVNLDVVCIVESDKVNKFKTQKIDEMITTVISNLGDWDFNGCSEPTGTLINNKYCLTALISVSHEFEL